MVGHDNVPVIIGHREAAGDDADGECPAPATMEPPPDLEHVGMTFLPAFTSGRLPATLWRSVKDSSDIQLPWPEDSAARLSRGSEPFQAAARMAD